MNSGLSSEKPYLDRTVDQRIRQLLEFNGAVLIEGPRACGKTMSALNAAESAEFLDSEQAAAIADISPSLLLDGARPRLLDEWQVMPEVWNLVRRAIDASSDDGQFILTGSSVPADDIARHTGAGRIFRLRQRTMTWSERKLSTDSVSLRQLFEGAGVSPSRDTDSLDDVIDNLCVSGFPAHISRTPEQTLALMNSYADDLSRSDISRLEDIRHDPEVLLTLLRALARATASEVTLKTLNVDVRVAAPSITPNTVARYLHLFERIYAVEKIPAWTGKLRSKANLRTSPKYMLADPALAVALLRATPQALRSDLETTGFVFESAVLHDLAVYVEAMGGQLQHYRDSYGNEIDAILTLPDGRWAAIEVKLGGRAAAPASDKLPRLIEQIDSAQPPTFTAVITGTGMTLPLGDNAVTFPLSALCF